MAPAVCGLCLFYPEMTMPKFLLLLAAATTLVSCSQVGSASRRVIPSQRQITPTQQQQARPASSAEMLSAPAGS